ncbi:MAG: SDR family NAD(P)-dependent oxidoreductase, partial [Hymenobacter sp.]
MSENQAATSVTPLAGKRVVVLGGTSGIGFATAAAAVAAGAQVIIGSKRQARVDEAKQQLGAHAEGHALDLTNEAQVRDFFAEVGAFDHLVFTAGDPLLLGEL